MKSRKMVNHTYIALELEMFHTSTTVDTVWENQQKI